MHAGYAHFTSGQLQEPFRAHFKNSLQICTFFLMYPASICAILMSGTASVQKGGAHRNDDRTLQQKLDRVSKIWLNESALLSRQPSSMTIKWISPAHASAQIVTCKELNTVPSKETVV
jgi:hypothetical protein